MLRSFLKDESGQGMVEYALIIALIAIAVIAAVILLGGKIGDTFKKSSNEMDKATATAAAGGGGA